MEPIENPFLLHAFGDDSGNPYDAFRSFAPTLSFNSYRIGFEIPAVDWKEGDIMIY